MCSLSKKWNIGISGLGVGMRHAKAIGQLENFEVSFLCDIDSSKRAEGQELFPNAKVTGSFFELVNSSLVDAVVIACNDDQHCSQILQCIANNKFFIVEKPICTNLADHKKIISALSSADKNYFLGSNLILREVELYKWIKRNLKNGYFGDIYSIEGQYLYGRLEKLTKGWRGSIKDYSVTVGGGIHLIDTVCWLIDDFPENVFAVGNKIVTDGHDYFGCDFVDANLAFKNGVIAKISSNFGCVHPHQHVFKIFGSKKTLIYDDKGPRVFLERNDYAASTPLSLECVPNNKSALILKQLSSLNLTHEKFTFSNYFRSLEVCFSIDQSLNSGKSIKVRYF